MGFGGTPYGAGGWGSGAELFVPPTETGPILETVVVRNNQIELIFLREYVIDDLLLDPDNYIITQDGAASYNIQVVTVEPGLDRATTDRVLLTTTTMKSGVTYTISAQTFLDIYGVTVDPLSEYSWDFRVSKIQNVMSRLPKHYNLEAGSLLSGLMTAIGTIDDQIGGNG